MFGLSPQELLVIGVVAVLLFGSSLPKVARSLGKSMSEFKKGMSDLQEEFHNAANETNTSKPRKYAELADSEEATAPKFEPPTSEPKPEERVST